MNLCKMCSAEPAGARSHVIAKGLVRKIDRKLDTEVRLYSADPDAPSPLRRTGSIDPSILGHACEKRFQRYDDHAVKALAVEPLPSKRWGLAEVYELPGADARLLKLAFMHTLWRAHASVLPEFADVALGPRGDVLRGMLQRDDPGSVTDFPIILIWHPADSPGFVPLMSTFLPTKWDNGARFFQLQIERWLVFLTTSSIGSPRETWPITLVPTAPVPVFRHPDAFKDSPMMALVSDVMRRRRGD
jgi:hypothetical protein